MFFITKRKLMKILAMLEADSTRSEKTLDYHDFCWKCGNANAVNFIKSKLGLK